MILLFTFLYCTCHNELNDDPIIFWKAVASNIISRQWFVYLFSGKLLEGFETLFELPNISSGKILMELKILIDYNF